jgi:hypothetical protein
LSLKLIVSAFTAIGMYVYLRGGAGTPPPLEKRERASTDVLALDAGDDTPQSNPRDLISR